MKKFSIVAIVLFSLLLCTALAANVRAEQLKHDDGSAEMGVEFDSVPYKAVKFTPSGTNRIESIQTYWYDDDGAPNTEKYRIWIYNSSGSQIYQSGEITHPTHGWNSFTIPQNISIKGDFYVVINAPTASSGDEMDLGLDLNTPFGYSYERVCVSYQQGSCKRYGFDQIFLGNYMIRATTSTGNIAPVLNSIIDSPDPVMSGAPLTVLASANDADSNPLGIVCKYSPTPSAANQSCSNYPQNVAAPYNGLNCAMLADSNNAENTIYCRAFDGTAYSNEEITTSTDDNEAPEVSIALGDNAGGNDQYDNDGSVFATLSRSDESGINNCKIDWGLGAGFEVINPNSISTMVQSFDDGTHTVTYKCRDNVGWENQTTDTIIVDTTAPTAPVLTVTESPRDTDNNVELSWTASTDANGIDKYEIWRSSESPLRPSEPDALIATVEGDVTSYADNALKGNTTYTWHIKAFDVVGNANDSNAESTRVDSDAPKTHIVSPVDGSYTNSPNVNVVADYSNTYNVSCQARVDGGAWNDMEGIGLISGTANYAFEGLSDGNHLIEVQCDDGPIGGLTSKDSVKVFVDTVAPEVEIELRDLPFFKSEYDNDGLVWAILDNSDAAPSSKYTCEINWQGTWTSINKNTVLDGRYFASDGNKTVEYRCTDRAGNVGHRADTILIDRVFPESSASVTNGTTCNGEWYSSDVEVSLTATDVGSGVEKIRYSLTGKPGSFSDYNSPLTISNEGATTVYYYSIDKADNWEIFSPTGLNKFTVRIDKTKPETVIVTPADTEHFALNNVLFTGLATDKGSLEGTGSGVNHTDIMIVKVSDNSTVLDWSSAEGTDIWDYNWTSTSNLEYRIYSRATDNACNVESTATATFTMQDDYDERYYTKEEINGMLDNISSQIDALNESLEDTNDEVSAIKTNLSMVWITIGKLYEEDTELWNSITAINGRINALEAELARMNHGTINLNWNGHEEELTVSGEAPEGSTRAVIEVFDSGNGHLVALPYTTTVSPSDNTYTKTLNANHWPTETLNIKVTFYNGSAQVSRPVKAIFESLLTEWLEDNQYGFEFVESKTFEVWNPQAAFSRNFNFGFMTKYHGFYKFTVVQDWSSNGKDISKTLYAGIPQAVGGQDQRTFLLESMTLPPEQGTYIVHLHAKSLFGTESYDSNRYVINVVDLSLPMPRNTLAMSEPEFPIGPKTQVYWTNKPLMTFSAIMQSTNGWSPALDCVARFTDELGNDEARYFDMTSPDEQNISTCRGTLNISRITENNRGPFRMKMCAEPNFHNPSGQDRLCDEMMVSFDNDTPVIDLGSVYPNASAIVHGVWNFSADATDNGEIQKVRFVLTSKNDSNKTCDLEYATSIDENTWSIIKDTRGECTPDGFYDFTVYVTDYAGNTVEATIDPLIDNTAPTVESISMSGSQGVNGSFEIAARVSDNLAGVEKVTAELQGYTCSNYKRESFELTWCNTVTEKVCGGVNGSNGTMITKPGEAYGHHGACSGWNSCGNASTCAQWACEVNGYQNLTSYGLEAPCTSFGNCNLFYSRGSVQMNWGNWCPVMGVTDIVCDGSVSCEDVQTTTCEGKTATCSNNTAACLSSCEESEEGVESCKQLCYENNCEYEFTTGDNNYSLSKTTACGPTFECSEENRVYEGFDKKLVEMTNTSGDALNGTWSAELGGLELASNTHYELRVIAADRATNINSEANYEETKQEFFSMPSYTVLVSTSVVHNVTEGVEFSILGEVISTDATTPIGEVVLTPWNSTTPLLLGQYQTANSLSPGNDQLITATYTPDSVCPEISYSGTTTVNVTAAVRRSGGGGGGALPNGNTCSWTGYKLVDGKCVKVETPKEEPEEQPQEQPTPESFSSESEQPQESAPSTAEEQPQTPAPEPESQDSGNLATGAVIGGGSANWWPLAVLGVVIAGLLAYFLMKKK